MSDYIIENARVVASREQVSGDLLDEDVIILSLKDGVYYGLNPVGSRIWNLVQEPRTVQDVIDQLLNEYEVDRERCKSEVLTLFKEMVDLGLVEIQDEATA